LSKVQPALDEWHLLLPNFSEGGVRGWYPFLDRVASFVLTNDVTLPVAKGLQKQTQCHVKFWHIAVFFPFLIRIQEELTS
jgi:hypothetical protein